MADPYLFLRKKRIFKNYVVYYICIYVGKYFKISQYEILGNKKKEYRNIAIYLIKKYSALTNYQLSQLFTNINYSTAAKVYQRFLKKVEEDPMKAI